MWSYYGSKSKIVHLYPPPKYGKVIEPFAGSARYSLKYFDRDVLLVDKYKVVVELWKWLQCCSEKDITSLPDMKPFDKITNYNLSTNERNLLGFLVQRGVARPGITVSEWRDKNNSPSVGDDLKRIARQLFKIKHWEIKELSYNQIENQTATWFIDPPYQNGGYKYVENKVDFKLLSEWSMNRKGQVMVCENTKADWMPFKPMVNMVGTIFKTTEAIWSNYPTSYDIKQTQLF